MPQNHNTYGVLGFQNGTTGPTLVIGRKHMVECKFYSIEIFKPPQIAANRDPWHSDGLCTSPGPLLSNSNTQCHVCRPLVGPICTQPHHGPETPIPPQRADGSHSALAQPLVQLIETKPIESTPWRRLLLQFVDRENGGLLVVELILHAAVVAERVYRERARPSSSQFCGVS